MSRITKEFKITTSPGVMERIERFLAMLHHNSNFGHSGTFAMWLDGDGSDKVVVEPTPKYSDEVELVACVGYEVEIAMNGGYTCMKAVRTETNWQVRPGAVLFKNDKQDKAIPSAIYRD